jgi:hypothetical protein
MLAMRNPEREQMKWRWLPPSKGDLAAIILAVLFASLAVFTLVRPPNYGRMWHHGFGPEWDCSYLPESEPVCIKKPARRAE